MSGHRTDSPRGVPLPPGLENSGNLCWLNAIMQALTHCKMLVEAIDTSMHCLNCTVGPTCVLCSVETHIKGISTAQREGAQPVAVAPQGIVRALPVISQTLLEGQQEDAHEFLRNLVSAMQASLTLAQERLNTQQMASSSSSSSTSAFGLLNRIWSKNSNDSGVSSNNTNSAMAITTTTPTTDSSSSCSSSKRGGKDTTTGVGSEDEFRDEYPFSLFRGSVHNQVLCTRCGTVSVKADPIEDLELEVSRASTLETALSDFCRVEVLSGANAYSCDVCQSKTTAHRCMQMHTVPAVLSIQLKRFVFDGKKSSKITHFVQYPEYLDLATYLTDEAPRAASTRPGQSPAGSTLELFAVVVHLGKTIAAGHYVAYVRNELGWYRMDDSRVRRCSPEEAMSQSAYILFYQCRDDPYAVPKRGEVAAALVEPAHRTGGRHWQSSQLLPSSALPLTASSSPRPSDRTSRLLSFNPPVRGSPATSSSSSSSSGGINRLGRGPDGGERRRLKRGAVAAVMAPVAAPVDPRPSVKRRRLDNALDKEKGREPEAEGPKGGLLTRVAGFVKGLFYPSA